MKLEAIVAELKEINNQEDIIGSGHRIQELKRLFEDELLKNESAEQIKQLKLAEEGVGYEKKEFDELKEELGTVYSDLISKRKKQLALKTTLERENLSQKKELIDQLKSLVQNEEKIGLAFNSLKTIQETWNKIGDVPRDLRSDIQKEYSRLIELFFYNINIYKELKDHDLKRNLQLKENVIFRLKNLRNSKLDIHELEVELRGIQNEWEEIGPVINDQWESLKENYWETVRGIYDKINQFYSDLKEKRKEIIEDKKKLILEIQALLESMPQFEKVSQWDNATKSVMDFQQKWKSLGNGPKKENDQVWKEFRVECDRFFEAKKAYFDSRKKSFGALVNQKKALIEELKSIDLNSDWKEITNKVIHLQNKWKKIGFTGKDDQKLWKEFRTLCDDIFSSRDRFQEEQNEVQKQNALKRKSFILKFQEEKMEGDRKEIQLKIYDSIRDFDELGEVSMKEVEKLNKDFKSAIEQKCSVLGIGNNTLEKLYFQIDLIGIKDAEQRQRFLQKERGMAKKNQDKILAEINQLENNMSFFSNSKTSGSLLKEFEDQIVELRQKLSAIESKLNSIPHE